MQLIASKLAIASAITTAILWIICSAVVAIWPDPSMTLFGYMMHMDLSGIPIMLNWTGFIVGLIAWVIIAAVIAWLIAAFYNRSLKG